MQTVVLAAGSSLRMGRDKLLALFAGVPLARRVVVGLGALRPLVVATPAVAAVLGGLPFARLIVTAPTAGPSVTLALADVAVPAGLWLAVTPCDLPFLDASRVRAFIDRVPTTADLAYPVVSGTPGHPVLWSPKARARIAGLHADQAPWRVRGDGALTVVPIELEDDGYVVDVDTPAAWQAAVRRAASAPGGRRIR